MARGRDMHAAVRDVDLRHEHWVDYDAPPRFADNVSMIDGLISAWTAVLMINDGVVIHEASNIAPQTLFVDDAAALSDAGYVSRYDYADVDYFQTPADYVGDVRVF